jgi:hypothetical protein
VNQYCNGSPQWVHLSPQGLEHSEAFRHRYCILRWFPGALLCKGCINVLTDESADMKYSMTSLAFSSPSAGLFRDQYRSMPSLSDIHHEGHPNVHDEDLNSCTRTIIVPLVPPEDRLCGTFVYDLQANLAVTPWSVARARNTGLMDYAVGRSTASLVRKACC